MFKQAQSFFFTPQDRHPSRWRPAYGAIQLGFLAGACGLLGRDLLILFTVDDWWLIIATELAFAIVIALDCLIHTFGYASTGLVLACIGGVGSATGFIILTGWQTAFYLWYVNLAVLILAVPLRFWFKWLIAFCFIGLYCLIYILFSEHTPIVDVPRLTVQILALSNIFGALLILGLPVVIYSGQLESQKQLATTAKLELDEKHQDLISSLNYAARMQRTILTSEEAVQDVFPGSYIFWRPQHIVGGDAYFLRRRISGKGAMFGVYDCTGHGVPGAFMTLLAERALDAGVEASRHKRQNPNRAGDILSHVDEFIRTVVNSESIESSNDGMDAFLLDFRPGEKSYYASANFKVFMQTERGFTELESDEASIGYRLETGETSPSYKTLPLDLSQAISLVIVSDGILDQKGGAKGLSLGRRRLKNLLEQSVKEDTGSKVLDGDYLMRAIHKYQGDEEQRDDMTLIVLSLRG